MEKVEVIHDRLRRVFMSDRRETTVIMISAEDLRYELDRAIEYALHAAEQQRKPTYLTRKQVMELLHISNGTFYSYIKKGKLNPVYIGKEPRFIEADVHEAVRSGKLRKYKQSNI